MYKALGSILSTKNKKQEDRSVYFAKLTLRSDSVTPLEHNSQGLFSARSAGLTDKDIAQDMQLSRQIRDQGLLCT